jgi:hypothetical protein
MDFKSAFTILRPKGAKMIFFPNMSYNICLLVYSLKFCIFHIGNLQLCARFQYFLIHFDHVYYVLIFFTTLECITFVKKHIFKLLKKLGLTPCL